jgi:hypothetical protein
MATVIVVEVMQVAPMHRVSLFGDEYGNQATRLARQNRCRTLVGPNAVLVHMESHAKTETALVREADAGLDTVTLLE